MDSTVHIACSRGIAKVGPNYNINSMSANGTSLSAIL